MQLEELIVKLGVQADTAKLESFAKLMDKIRIISNMKGLKRALGTNTTAALNHEMGKTLTAFQKLKVEMEALSEEAERKEYNTKMRIYAQQAREAARQVREVQREADRLANIKPASLEGRRYGFKSAANATEMFSEKLQRVNPIVEEIKSKIGALGALAGVGFSFQQYLQISDQWKTISAQIKNVSKNSQEAESSQQELYNIASRTRQSYAETAGLFTSVSRSASELGKSSNDILKFTEDVSNAMLLGGGSAASQQAALVQLGQALGSGTLRGDELNSIMEQAPRLAQVIAQGMGTTIGNLRQMGANGEITAQKVFEAVRSQSEKLKGELGNMPWTVQQAATKAQNAMGMLFYTIENKLNIGSTIAAGIAQVATILERINNILAKMPVEDIYNWLTLIAITAGVIFAILKRNAIIMVLQTVISLLGITSVGFTGAAAAAGVFQAASIRAAISAAAAWLVAAAPIALVVAAIVLLILIINDLYVWINGGDSVMGRWLGSFENVSKKAKKAWQDFVVSCEEWTKQHFIDCIKDMLGWIDKLIVYLTGLGFLFDNAKMNSGPLIDTSKWGKPLYKTIDWNKDVLHGGPNVIANDYSGAMGRFGGINNSATQTNYNTVNIMGGTSSEIAKATTDAVFNPPDLKQFGWGG